eukprot:1415571-Prymnesium_polylepis.1
MFSREDQVPIAQGVVMSDAATPVVMGIPLTDGSVGRDAVRLLERQTENLLTHVNAFAVTQRPSMTEAL